MRKRSFQRLAISFQPLSMRVRAMVRVLPKSVLRDITCNDAGSAPHATSRRAARPCAAPARAGGARRWALSGRIHAGRDGRRTAREYAGADYALHYGVSGDLNVRE
jgi:hypothetical protein